MADVPVGELVIVRFSPFAAARLGESAQDDYDRALVEGTPPFFGISTYGLVRSDSSTTVDSLIERICKEAPCGGKNVCVVTKTSLEAAGFAVQLSEPPKLHYDVILGSELRKQDTERLEELLESGRRRNPAWQK